MQKPGEKIAVISGGAGGLGRSAALRLAELEYYPILLDRDDGAGKKTAAALLAAGFESEFYCVSLRTSNKLPKPLPTYWPDISELTLW